MPPKASRGTKANEVHPMSTRSRTHAPETPLSTDISTDDLMSNDSTNEGQLDEITMMDDIPDSLLQQLQEKIKQEMREE